MTIEGPIDYQGTFWADRAKARYALLDFWNATEIEPLIISLLERPRLLTGILVFWSGLVISLIVLETWL